MPARSGDTEMVSARNEYGPIPGAISHYVDGAAAFKEGLPQGSNYAQFTATLPESPYAVTAADFVAGVSQASNYTKISDIADPKTKPQYAATAAEFKAGV